MHPEILSMALFWIVAAYTPGPNNVIASYSGFNFGIKKTLPHIFGVTFGFPMIMLARACRVGLLLCAHRRRPASLPVTTPSLATRCYMGRRLASCLPRVRLANACVCVTLGRSLLLRVPVQMPVNI